MLKGRSSQMAEKVRGLLNPWHTLVKPGKRLVKLIKTDIGTWLLTCKRNTVQVILKMMNRA